MNKKMKFGIFIGIAIIITAIVIIIFMNNGKVKDNTKNNEDNKNSTMKVVPSGTPDQNFINSIKNGIDEETKNKLGL